MKNIFCCTLLFISSQLLAQHNSVYSQYVFNALIINPAYAGSQDALDITALYRNQWLGVDGSPKTITFSAHTPLRNTHQNIGVSFINDEFGISKHNKINAIYSFKAKFRKSFLSLGLQGGVDIAEQNWNRIKTIKTDDPAFNYNQRSILPQAGFGLYYQSRHFFSGLSAPSLLNSNYFSPFPVIFYAGGLIPLGDNFRLKPTMLLKYLRHSPMEADANLTMYIKEIVGVGAGYRLNDAVLAFFDLRITDQFRLGYCYDYTLSRLKTYTSGSHEIMLRYIFSFKSKSQNARYF